MSSLDATAGYPVHAVKSYRWRVTENQVTITDWTAFCGETGQLVGSISTFGQAGSARCAELCPACWPGQYHHAYHPEPLEET